MSITYNVGNAVFFRHPLHSWVRGSVTASSATEYTCKVEDPERSEVQQGELIQKLKANDLEMFHPECVEDAKHHDLLQLSVLHDATLLRCLYLRYMNDVIYTNIGAIVVALNPFNFKIPRYMDDKMVKYVSTGKHLDKVPNHGLYPHSWAQAHNTYFEMVEDQQNQCILISGESGAGKTEATKIVMKYLGAISSREGSDEEKRVSDSVGKKLSSCSPILECFGNAKTVRNDNSSRFGKFMEVKFNRQNRLVGSNTTKYLLEKSRILTASEGERVYHAFYVVLRGKYKGMFQFESEANYTSINSGKTLSNKEFDTAQDFEEVCDAMATVGLTDDEIKSVWHIPAAVLNLLNVTFVRSADGEGCSVEEKTAKYLQQAAKLLMVPKEELEHEILHTTVQLKEGPTVKRNTFEVASDARNALCKHMYDGAFSWLVTRGNDLCDVASDGNWIGLLDIFGFEDFKFNSFEQLCINLTNETLQGHYNLYIFTKDMDECRAEGIDVANIQFPDNGPCLKMMSGQGGIMPLLDDCGYTAKRTDFDFLELVDGSHGKNVFYAKNKVSRDTFVIKHYAADVTYNVVGWIEKNKDIIRDEMKLMLRRSTDPVIAVALPAPIPLEQKKGKEPTVGGFFCAQLKSLMDKINGTNPHWIRCVKPHPAKEPKKFHGVQTMNQLESSGVLGTVKIRKAGYPVRIPMESFIKKFRVCTTNPLPSQFSGDEAKRCVASILQNANVHGPANSQIGHTKVFLKTHALVMLERFREESLKSVVDVLQVYGRAYLERKEMFLKFVEKHRAEIEAQRRERERQEREAREAEERAQREAEEKARLIREAEERRRKREEQRLLEKRTKAAQTIQRYVRGDIARNRVYRLVLENTRAKYEAVQEEQLREERRAAIAIDVKRRACEISWIAWLNQAENLSKKDKVDLQRAAERERQRVRIAVREISRKEDELREQLDMEENAERQNIVVRCEVLAKHRKQLLDQQKKVRSMQQTSKQAGGVSRPQNFQAAPPSHLSSAFAAQSPAKFPTFAQRSAMSDERTRATLTDYAIQRARVFETQQNVQYTSTPNVQTSSYLTGPPPGTPAELLTRSANHAQHTDRALFDLSKNRWAAEDAFFRRNGATPGGAGDSSSYDASRNVARPTFLSSIDTSAGVGGGVSPRFLGGPSATASQSSLRYPPPMTSAPQGAAVGAYHRVMPSPTALQAVPSTTTAAHLDVYAEPPWLRASLERAGAPSQPQQQQQPSPAPRSYPAAAATTPSAALRSPAGYMDPSMVAAGARRTVDWDAVFNS